MPITGKQAIGQIRRIGSVPNQPQGRWSDTGILSFVDMAEKHLVQELMFPESRLVGTAISNQQEYPMPDTHEIYRVYLDGQICVKTYGGIATLEGRQIGLYDTTGEGVSVPGSGAAQGGTSGQPKWAVLTPQSYPYLQNLGSPSLTAPASISTQGRYYERDGVIGFVPAPANTAEITIEGVLVPPDLLTPLQKLIVPSYYMDALVWYSLVLMKFADDTQSTQDQRNFAEQKYQENLKKLRTRIRQYQSADTMQMVRNDRINYSFGRRTNGGFQGSSNW